MSSGILEILEDINSDSKRTHKIAVITKHKDNELFKRVLLLALDPMTQFYIRKIPEYSHVSVTESLESALSKLALLSERKLTGNAGIMHLTGILSSLHPSDATVVERIIGKDLRCGAADSTVNAVIKDFIFTYPCLLARPYEDKNLARIVYPAISQLKADGKRTNCHYRNGVITICGRSGKVMDFGTHFDAMLTSIRNLYGSDFMLDGELVVVDEFEKIVDRKTGNGILNKATLGTISESEISRVRFAVWDIIKQSEFTGGKSNDSYITRFTILKSLLQSKVDDLHLIRLIDTRIVNSLEEATEHFYEMLANGEEGTILKNYKGIWSDTRSPDIVKLKDELACEMEVIGWNPGTGKYEGQVGSLMCASSDRKVVADISGFTELLRLTITENINSYIGKIVKIKYNERISSKGRDGVDSLFLPRYDEFRDDKVVADSSNEIPTKVRG